MFVFPNLIRLLPRQRRTATRLRIAYQDGRGLLRTILIACTQLRFAIDHVDVELNGPVPSMREQAQDLADIEGTDLELPRQGVVALSMQVRGKRPVSHLIARLSDIDGVLRVSSLEDDTRWTKDRCGSMSWSLMNGCEQHGVCRGSGLADHEIATPRR